ncbi:MAG: ABC transporter ATP-binding protein [Gammaproteobacteria bacterium]|nr:ABC transporter ATP-binding protein [Gammaproteobacteria bacterium]
MRYSEHTSPVLQGLELQVNRGEFVAILGRSGSGKSTLLKLIGAMEQATSGNLIVAGHNLGELDETARTLFRRRKIGFVFQNYNLLSSLTVRDNLRLPLALNRVPDDSRVQQQLETLNLGHLRDRYPGSLSGGEQQRVALARALIHRPPVVLADEPTGNLDRSTSEEVLTLLQSLIRAHGTTVVMATHSQEAARIADSIYALDEGCLVAQHQ